MDTIILSIVGIFISCILILFGIILIYFKYSIFEKTEGIIDEAKCALNRDFKNFVYNCEVKLYHIIKNKKYIIFKNIKTRFVPYRKYDKIEIFYNKNDPSDIITNEMFENIYIYIPLIMGIILLILTITLYLIFM